MGKTISLRAENGKVLYQLYSFFCFPAIPVYTEAAAANGQSATDLAMGLFRLCTCVYIAEGSADFNVVFWARGGLRAGFGKSGEQRAKTFNKHHRFAMGVTLTVRKRDAIEVVFAEGSKQF
jgi:hypothetical protein